MLRWPIKMNLALAFGKVFACALITTLYFLSAQAVSADELPKRVLIITSDDHFVPENLLLAFPNKIINIHPALLPKYGGKGMYGDHVHKAIYIFMALKIIKTISLNK